MGSGIRYRVERIALALMAAAGIMVLLVDLLGWLDRFSADTLSKITLLILSTVTLFLLLEVDRLKVVDNINAQLSKLDIDTIARELRQDHYAGVLKVHERFSEDAFIKYLTSAEHEVEILQTWIPNLHRFELALGDAILNRGVTVRVLLLFPTSPVADLRNEALRTLRDPALEEAVKGGVERCLSILEAIFRRIGADRERLRVRVYNSLPSIAVYRADEHYFVSSFLHGQLAIDSPQIEIEGKDTAMGREVQHELDTLWAIGRAVDLKDWRGSLGAISF